MEEFVAMRDIWKLDNNLSFNFERFQRNGRTVAEHTVVHYHPPDIRVPRNVEVNKARD